MSKKKLGNLDTYEEEVNEEEFQKFIETLAEEEKKEDTNFEKNEKNFFEKIWEKTVFPDMIKRKKEEKELKKEIMHRARLQALKESEDELIKQYKQEHLDKLSGKKKKGSFLEKIGKSFAEAGKNMGSSDKIENMMGTGNHQNNNGPDILGMMGGQQQNNKFDMFGTKPKEDEYEYVEVPQKGKKKKKILRKVKKKQQNNTNDFEAKIKNFLG